MSSECWSYKQATMPTWFLYGSWGYELWPSPKVLIESSSTTELYPRFSLPTFFETGFLSEPGAHQGRKELTDQWALGSACLPPLHWDFRWPALSVSALLLGCRNAGTLLREGEVQSEVGVSVRVSPCENTRDWVRCCGSQTPVYATGDHEELGTGVRRPTMSPGLGGIQFVSK